MSLGKTSGISLGKILILLLFISALGEESYSQELKGKVSGRVAAAGPEHLEYVSVVLEGTTIGVIPDNRGNFTIRAKAGNYLLSVSHTGYETYGQNITIESGKTLQIGTIILKKSDKELEEVTVQSSRRNKFTNISSDYVAKLPLTNLENPQVYSSVSGELMESQQTYLVKDALNNVASIHKLWDANGRASTGGAYYTLRGFSTQSMLRNGVSGNVTTTIDVANLERIEVIKGPSATLYGSSLTSFGGLINRVTKKPQAYTFGTVNLSGGNFSAYRISADYNTPLNKDKTLLMRLNSAYSSKESFQDAGFTRSFVFAPSLNYQVNDRLSISVDGEFFKTKNSDFQGIYLYDTPNNLGVHKVSETNINFDLAYKSNDIYNESNVGNLFGQAIYKISNNWTSQTNISFTTSKSDGPAPFFYLVPNSTITGNPSDAGSDYLSRCVWIPSGNDHSFEIQQNFIVLFPVGTIKNKLMFGLDYYNYSRKLTYFYFLGNYNGINAYYMFDYVNLTGAISNYYNFNKNNINRAFAENTNTTLLSLSETNTYSAYALDIIEFSPRLSAMLSARVDRFDNGDTYNPTTDATTKGYGQTAFSPKLGLVYQPVPKKVALFVNYQNGFQNVAPVTQQDGTISDFKPKQANQWEGGVKLNLLNERVNATFSYYDISVKNNTRSETRTVNIDGTPTTVQYTVQDGTQYSKGAEAEVVANPVGGLNLIFSYAYNKSRWKKSTDNVNGLRPINSGPENSANAWISYNFRGGALNHFGIGFGGNYSGETLIANTKSGGKFELPSYTVLNASLFYDNSAFRVGFHVKNLNDKNYYTGYSTISPQAPRQFSLDLKFRF